LTSRLVPSVRIGDLRLEEDQQPGLPALDRLGEGGDLGDVNAGAPVIKAEQAGGDLDAAGSRRAQADGSRSGSLAIQSASSCPIGSASVMSFHIAANDRWESFSLAPAADAGSPTRDRSCGSSGRGPPG
jgi:hypothetical protein